VAVGHGMLGITLAPHTATVLTRLARGEAPDPQLHALRPERFGPSRRRRDGRR
jgi:glycine/D-amino acid oxidase-like deaminating enzyme